MRSATITVSFTNDYGKLVEATISRDSYGELTVKSLSINGRFFNAKQIRTEWRESVVIDYCRQFVDIEEYFADELFERDTHHCQDNF